MYKILSLIILMSVPMFGNIENEAVVKENVTLSQVTQPEKQTKSLSNKATAFGTRVAVIGCCAPITVICAPTITLWMLYSYMYAKKDNKATKETNEKN